MLKALIKTMRPRQWTKNIFIFAALVFDKQLFLPSPFLRTLAGFFLFCLISSAVYIVNDLADVEAFVTGHPGRVAVEVYEAKLPQDLVGRGSQSAARVLLDEAAQALYGWRGLSAFYEVGLGPSWRDDVASLAELLQPYGLPAGFKLRCGGLEPVAFPTLTV